MAQVLVRDLKPETLEHLKNSAKRNGRSLQAELKAILKSATVFSMDEARQTSDRWHKRLAGRVVTDSGELRRENRDR